MTTGKSVCVIGMGNPLRSDDGAGSTLCRKLEALALPGVTVMEVYQLQTELLADLAGFTHILIVDALLESTPFGKYPFWKVPLLESGGAAANLSHHMEPGLMRELLKRLYGAEPEVLLLEVPVQDLGYDNTLTKEGEKQVEAAYQLLLQWLGENGFMTAQGD